MTLNDVEENAPALLPRGARLGLYGVSGVAHLALIVALSLGAQEVQVLAPLNIDVIPQGDYLVDTVAIPGAAAAEAVEQHQTEPPVEAPNETVEAPPEQPPSPAPPDANPMEQAAPPPALVTPDPDARTADLQAQEQAKQQQRQQEEAEAREKAAEKARERRQKEKRKRLLEKRRQILAARQAEKSEAQTTNQGGSEGHRAGVANGQALRAARFNYGMLVAAELNRHKAYPSAARARGEAGSVGVSFTIGPSGRVASHSIVRSSGSAALDGAVRAMMASAHAPPPPGGVFHGSISINFNLER